MRCNLFLFMQAVQPAVRQGVGDASIVPDEAHCYHRLSVCTPPLVEPSNDVPYAHEMQAGDRYAPLRFCISREINEQYLFALGDYAARYLVGDCGRGQVHPVLLLHMSARTRSPSFRLAPGMGSVFARDRVTFHRPAIVDEWLEVQWTIREVYERKARIYQALQTRVMGDRGDVVIERDAHSVFFEGRA
jgi:hypothetical protein